MCTPGQMELTGRARVCSTCLDSGALPALDGIEHALLLFAFRGKTGDFLACYHGSTGRLIYDARKNSSSVATGHSLSNARLSSGLEDCSYTAETIAPSAYMSEATD